MKKIKWLVVSLLLGAAVFIGGLYLGNLEPERATGFSVGSLDGAEQLFVEGTHGLPPHWKSGEAND